MNMRVRYNTEAIRANIRRKIKAFDKAKIGSSKRLARYTLLQAKLRAARHTGETMRGITISPTKKGWRCVSEVSGSFKQNLFQNRQSPYSRLNFGRKGGIDPATGNKYFGPNQSIAYGQPATSWSGRPIRWTGHPGFFDIAVAMARKKAKTITLRATKSALKTGVAMW